MKTKKYLVFGGEIYSQHDGQRHYISATEVAKLYGVDLRECYLINDWRESVGHLRNRRDLIVLYPDGSGAYTLNTAA